MSEPTRQVQQEQAATMPSAAELERAAHRTAVHQGEVRGQRLMLIWLMKMAEQTVQIAGIGVDVSEGHGTDPTLPHDWISTGDPCWCGSDNCEVCLICLEENHD